MSLDSATHALNYPKQPTDGESMTTMATHKRTQRHAGTGTGTRTYPWPLLFIAAPAAVAVWSGWVGLGSMCGFGVIHPLPGIMDGLRINTDITLPVGIESYGAYALYVWIGGRGSKATCDWAKRSAIGALVLGCLGQVAFHLLDAAGWAVAPWPVVVLVACLPVVTLSFAAALFHQVRSDTRAAEQAEAEAAARAEARAAAKAELPARKPGSADRNRKQTGTGPRKQPAGTTTEATPIPLPEPAPEPEETIDIDAEARILQLIAEGKIDPEGAVLQLVGNGVSASKAGVLVGKSDSYGRQVVRTAKKLTETAPAGPDAAGSDS